MNGNDPIELMDHPQVTSMGTLGPNMSGPDILVIPWSSGVVDLRTAASTALRAVGHQLHDEPSPGTDPSIEPDAASLMTITVGTAHGFGLIMNSKSPHRVLSYLTKDTGGTGIHIGNSWDRAWWYYAFEDGHAMDRHCSIPEILIEELEPEEYYAVEADIGSNEARRNFALHWKGRAENIGRALGCDPELTEPYLRQYTIKGREAIVQGTTKGLAAKAYPKDQFILASQWVFLDLLAKGLGDAIHEQYWKMVEGKGRFLRILAKRYDVPQGAYEEPDCCKVLISSYKFDHELYC